MTMELDAFYAGQPMRHGLDSVTLAERIEQLVAQHGSLRAVGRVTGIDPGYLSRLRSGEKARPEKDKLRRLGLRRVVVYELLRPNDGIHPLRSSRVE